MSVGDIKFADRKYPGYESTVSDGEASVTLEPWGM